MKKFTVISLLLVLVAGFAFAGLTPYVTSGYGITFKSVVLEDGVDKDSLNDAYLKEMALNGNFVLGLKDDNVDISFTNAAKYYSLPKYNAIYKKDANGLYKTPTSAKEKADTFIYDGTLSVDYANGNIIAGASADYTAARYAISLFQMDQIKRNHGGSYNDQLKDKLTVDAYADYAQSLKNNGNIVRVFGFEKAVFDEKLFKSSTTAQVAYYVPAEGTTPADTLGDFLATTPFTGFKFKAQADAGIDFTVDNAKINWGSVIKYAGVDLQYRDSKIVKGVIALDANVMASKEASDVTISGGAEAGYTFTKAVGAGTYDKFVVTANADVTFSRKGSEDATKEANASVKVQLPRLIPFESIENAAYNLPADFTAAYYYEGVSEHNLTFTANVHPFYVKFAKTVTVFDEALKSLDVKLTYSNTAKLNDLRKSYYNADDKKSSYSFSASATLALEKGSFSVSYAMKEDVENKASFRNQPGLVTVSYSKNYK